MDSARAVSALGALAQATRLQVFRLLIERGAEGLPAGVIADRAGVPPSSLTFHLQQLLHAGLVTQRRLSRQLIYAADLAVMNALVAYLTENCCGRGVPAAPACDPACMPQHLPAASPASPASPADPAGAGLSRVRRVVKRA